MPLGFAHGATQVKTTEVPDEAIHVFEQGAVIRRKTQEELSVVNRRALIRDADQIEIHAGFANRNALSSRL
jgi:hypothetical protein